MLKISSHAAEIIEDREIQGQINNEDDQEATAQAKEAEAANEVWVKFSDCMEKLLPMKIFETLIVPRMKIGDKRLPVQEIEYHNQALKFRRLFSLESEVTPELIWKSDMRDELRKVLALQLDSILKHSVYQKDYISDPDIFRHIISKFQYTVDKKELKIDGIFVKHYNDDIFFRPPNMPKFVRALLQRLYSDT